jgi:hypothetical protein
VKPGKSMQSLLGCLAWENLRCMTEPSEPLL